MKVAKVFRVFLAAVLLVSLTPAGAHQAQQEDILDFLPAITSSCPCKFSALRTMLKNYAAWFEYLMQYSDPQAKDQIQNYVRLFNDTLPQSMPGCGSAKDAAVTPKVVLNAQGKDQVYISNRAEVYYLLGAQAVYQGSRLVALWCFSEAAWRYPNAPNFLNNAAFAFIEVGLYDDALKILKCAQALAPDWSPVYVNQGVALARLGRYKDAGLCFKKAFTYFPNNRRYCYLAAVAYQKGGISDEARGMAEIGKANFPNDYDWDAILNALPPPPSPPNTGECPCYAECMSNPTCQNLDYNLFNLIASISDVCIGYWSITNGSLDKARTKANACWNSFSYDFNIPCSFWRWQYNTTLCDINLHNEEIRLYADNLSYMQQKMAEYSKNANAMYNGSRGLLTACQRSWLECSYGYPIYIEDIATNSRNHLITATYDLADDIRFLNSLADEICAGGSINPQGLQYYQWVLNGGEWTHGMEPEYCLGIACFSADTDGTISFKMQFILGFKFEWSPFSGDVAAYVGAGFGGGLGNLSAGASVWVQLNNNGGFPFKGAKAEFEFLGSKATKVGVFEHIPKTL